MSWFVEKIIAVWQTEMRDGRLNSASQDAWKVETDRGHHFFLVLISSMKEKPGRAQQENNVKPKRVNLRNTCLDAVSIIKIHYVTYYYLSHIGPSRCHYTTYYNMT